MNEEQTTVNDDEVIKVSKNVKRIIICIVEKWPFRKFSLADYSLYLSTCNIELTIDSAENIS